MFFATLLLNYQIKLFEEPKGFDKPDIHFYYRAYKCDRKLWYNIENCNMVFLDDDTSI